MSLLEVLPIPGSKETIVDEIFERFLGASRIFRNRDVLRHDYLPDHLPHREEQISRLAVILSPVLKGSRGSNAFIYGKTGTGKTAVSRFVLKKLVQKCDEVGRPIHACYVNCRIAGTAYRVLASLCESIGVYVPFTGLATGEVFHRFRKGVFASKRPVVVVLDEIDALVKAHGDDVLYELTRINEGVVGGGVVIVGISNDLRFKEYLDPKVLSSLSEEEVVFRPYTANELYDILTERASAAFLDGVVSDAAIRLCAALAASEHGDARRALDLLRVAGEIAEREEANRVTEDHVRRAQEKIEYERVVEVLKTLPFHAKLVVCSVYLLEGLEKPAATGDVYEVYKRVCSEVGVDPLTQRRISGIINELDAVGVLNARVVSMGRYGRTKHIGLGIPKLYIRRVFLGDEVLSRFFGEELSPG